MARSYAIPKWKPVQRRKMSRNAGLFVDYGVEDDRETPIALADLLLFIRVSNTISRNGSLIGR